MSILAKELRQEYRLAKEYIQAGFQHASIAGELLAEVESMVGAEELPTWLEQNCSEVSPGEVEQFLKLFRGEKIKVEAYKPEKEVQEEK